MSALKGRILEGGQGCQYRVEEPLDLDELGSPKGAMARVFRVLELQNDQQRAAKIINPRLLDDEPGIRKRFLAQFYKEARIMEELQHPNIVRLYDYNTENELPFLIMDYIEGETLDDRLRRQGRFSFQEALAILEPVIMALAYAHSRGVIHRDIKPSNILLDWHGKAYLSDFGIARAAQESGLSSRTALTLGPYQFGTPMYMAPEQALRLSEAVGPQTDQYSLAVLVWRMLAGRYYLARVDSKEAIDYSKLVIGGSPLPLSRYAPNLPPRAEQAIVKALTKSPYERFDSVLDFLDELRNALNDPDGMPPSNPLLGWEEPEWLVPPIPLASSKKEWEEPEWLNPAEASSREKGWEESEWLSPEDLKAKAKQWEESEWLKPAEHLAEGWEAPTWFNFTAQKVEQKLETLPPPTLTPVEPAPSTASALEQEEDEEDLGWLDSLKLDDDHLEDFTFSNVEQIEQNRAVLTPVNVEEKPATEPLDLTLPEWFNGDAATPAPPRTLSSAPSAHSPVLPTEARERKSQPLPPLRERGSGSSQPLPPLREKGSGSQPLREKGSQPLPSFETRERESQPLPPLREKGNGSQPLREKGNGSQPLREKGNGSQPLREKGNGSQPLREKSSSGQPLAAAQVDPWVLNPETYPGFEATSGRYRLNWNTATTQEKWICDAVRKKLRGRLPFLLLALWPLLCLIMIGLLVLMTAFPWYVRIPLGSVIATLMLLPFLIGWWTNTSSLKGHQTVIVTGWLVKVSGPYKAHPSGKLLLKEGRSPAGHPDPCTLSIAPSLDLANDPNSLYSCKLWDRDQLELPTDALNKRVVLVTIHSTHGPGINVAGIKVLSD